MNPFMVSFTPNAPKHRRSVMAAIPKAEFLVRPGFCMNADGKRAGASRLCPECQEALDAKLNRIFNELSEERQK